jgi:hypothetical protein
VGNVLIRDSRVTAPGKQAVLIQRVRSGSVQRVEASGGYFVLDVRESNVVVEDSVLVQRRPGDDHSMLWTDASNLYVRSTRIEPHSGRGFISGTNLASNHIRVENVLSAPALDAWVQQHPNYRNLDLWLYGEYPSETVDFYFNPFRGGGVSRGSAVHRERADGAEHARTRVPTMRRRKRRGRRRSR